MTKYFLPLFAVFLLACAEQKGEIRRYEMEGFELGLEPFSMYKPFSLDSLQYSDGKTQYILSGDFFINSDQKSFSVLLNSSPKSELCQVLSGRCPISDSLDESFSCDVSYNKGVCCIVWKNDTKKFVLRNSLTLGY